MKEREKIIVENEAKSKKNEEDNFKVFTPEEALYAIDNYSYIIDMSGSPTSPKEKAIRAYLITKLVHLEINHFKILDYNKMEKMVNEAAALINECQLSIKTDPWIETLLNSQNIIKQKLGENKQNNISRLNSFCKEIDGNNDNDNRIF